MLFAEDHDYVKQNSEARKEADQKDANLATQIIVTIVVLGVAAFFFAGG